MERSVLQGLAAFRWGAWCGRRRCSPCPRDDLSRKQELVRYALEHGIE